MSTTSQIGKKGLGKDFSIMQENFFTSRSIKKKTVGNGASVYKTGCNCSFSSAKMTGRVRYLAAALLLLGAAAAVLGDEEVTTTEMPLEEMGDQEHYPESWTKISFKPLIDNERLYKKYKECLLDEHPTGCPRDVLEFKSEFFCYFLTVDSYDETGTLSIKKVVSEYKC